MDSETDTKIGLSTKEALNKLANDITKELHKCQCQRRSFQSFLYWLRSSYHHSTIPSTFRWPSALLLAGESIIYFIAYSYGHFSNSTPLLLEGIILLFILLFNVVLIGWDTREKHFEMHNKAKLLSNQIKKYQDSEELLELWMSHQFYPHLHTPQSPCISLQWAFRDGKLINLPTVLLVEGDVIMLCPGHSAPGKCRNIEPIHDNFYTSESNQIELEAEELFVPSADIASEAFTNARLRKIVEPVKFLMLETVYLNYLNTITSHKSSQRPATAFEKELHVILTKYIQKVLIPLITIIIFLVSAIHYSYLETITNDSVTLPASITLVLLRTAMTILPILPLTLPLSWILLNAYGIAHLLQCFYNFTSQNVMIHESPGGAIGSSFSKIKDHIKSSSKEFYLEELDSDRPTIPLIDLSMSWQSLYKKMKGLLSGNDETVWRSSNILQVLGSITALCCVDKKGILSWPNPTADKLFFLTSKKNKLTKQDSDDEDDSDDDFEEYDLKQDKDSLSDDESRKMKKNNSKADCIQLDITHDTHNAYGLQFDDTEWKRYLCNLKPLGLSILLNTCMKSSQDEYEKFCNHIACESLHNEAAVPVVNKRCLCELARQIGFKETAANGYEYAHQIGLFRHVRPEVIQKGKLAKSLNFPRLKMPFPNMACAVIKDIYTNTYQLFSQGTGDLVLDACTEYWDGQDLNIITDSDRKKILDFYQRTSLTAYCMSFAYVPLTLHETTKFNDFYIELPPDSSHLFPSQKSLDSSVRSGEHHHQVFLELSSKSISSHHLSSDSILKQQQQQQVRPKSCAGDPLHDTFQIESLMHQMSNEVFIGMVAMQYQACADFVQLVEQLEHACIRFVHFSKENELRSRVFSEKMGLESGWNCHISLLNDNDGNENISSVFLKGSKSSLIHESQTLTSAIGRSQSAPSSVNLEISTVKFVGVDETKLINEVTLDDSNDIETEKNGYETVPDNEEDDENDSLKQNKFNSNISPAPSRLTESTGTDHSAPIAFDMSNRAKLPKGIENIRPHLEEVDNVPLLVSLFTDCVPEATKEMIKIMQQYGEVVCVLGSSANFHNMPIFLQSDASIGIEPMYPQVCITEPVKEADLFINDSSLEDFVGPIELAKQLITLPCSLSMNRQDSYSLYSLIMEARHYMMKMRNSFQFFLCSCLSVSLAQLFSSMLFLPPIFAPGIVLWLPCIILPILSVSLMGTPFDEQVMNVSTGKNLKLSKETILYFLLCFIVNFIPSTIITVTCFGMIIGQSCQQTNLGSSTIGPCWMFSDVMANGDVNTDRIWSGHLLIGQTFAAFILVIYLVFISIGFVNQSYLLWQRSPFNNRWWIYTIFVILVLHSIVCIIETFYVPDGVLIKFISSIPIYTWCLALLWPFVLLSINTLMKRYEIKVHKRQQRRSRLEFGTKLGMNSPF